jgi:hypothetical protein
MFVAGSLGSTSLTAQRITPEEAAALGGSFFVDENGNVYRSIGSLYKIMSDALVHHELARLGLRQPAQTAAAAPWRLPRYINQNRQGGGTNFALRDAMKNFYLEQAPNFYNPFPQNWVIPPLNDDDLRVSAAFTAAFVQSFRDDAFSRTLPFNGAYLARALDNVDFYFATRRNRWYWNGESFDFYRANYQHSGFFDHRNNVVFISATREWSDIWGYQFVFQERFARISIHEVGHVLGLGESLAHLFEEKFMGLDAPLRPGNWERDSSFDRTLLALAGYEDFWSAAFTSNGAYGDLWDMHLGYVVTFADLQRARGMAHILRVQGRLPSGYKDIPAMLYRAFAPDTADVMRPLYISQIQLAISNLNSFITDSNLETRPVRSVFDEMIPS